MSDRAPKLSEWASKLSIRWAHKLSKFVPELSSLYENGSKWIPKLLDLGFKLSTWGLQNCPFGIRNCPCKPLNSRLKILDSGLWVLDGRSPTTHIVGAEQFQHQKTRRTFILAGFLLPEPHSLEAGNKAMKRRAAPPSKLLLPPNGLRMSDWPPNLSDLGS